MEEQQWLEQYVERGSEEAFALLVKRHLSLVYGVALRYLRDPHAAEDAAQATFVLLARKASTIRDASALPNWLFKAARYAAANAARIRQTRRRHEEKAAAMRTEQQPPQEDPTWQQILPALEQAMEMLGDADRQAILLRFYEDRSLREVGASLGVSEEAARKRVDRALTKLREALVPAGVALGASADLAAILAANACTPAPAALALSIASTACQAAAQATVVTTLIKGATTIMTTTTAKIAAVTVGTLVLVGGAAVIVGEVRGGGAPVAAPAPAPVAASAAAPQAAAVPAADSTIKGRPVQEIIDAIVIGETTREELVGMLGEPTQYLWQNQAFTPDRLPDRYVMLYPGLNFMMVSQVVEEMRFEGLSPYRFKDKIGFGTPLAEVLEVLGQPRKTVEGQAVAFEEGVLYRKCRSNGGFDGYYQRSDQGVRLFLAGDHVAAVYLTRTRAADDLSGGSIMTDAIVAQLEFGKSTREDVVRLVGEPMGYTWNGKTFTKETLPETYIIAYRCGDGVAMQNGRVAEIRIHKEGQYSFKGLRINSKMADVAKALGAPAKTVSGRHTGKFADNIWYKEIDDLPGRGYFQRSDLGVRMFLRNDEIAALYLIPPKK